MTLPKLNLRDLFWLVVVVAMGWGWWLHYRELQEAHVRAEHLAAKLEQTQEGMVQLMNDRLRFVNAAEAEGYWFDGEKKSGPLRLRKSE